MTDSHKHIDNDTLAVYALDALPPEEILAVATHLQDCAVCRQEVASLQTAAGLIPYGLALAEPPPDLRERILERTRSSRAPVRGPAAEARREQRRPLSWWWRLAPVAAAIAIVAAFLLGRSWPTGAGQDLATRPDAREVTLSGQGTGTFVVTPGGREARLSIAGLPALSGNRVYQLWFLGSGGAVSGGTFTVDAQGRADFTISGIAWSPGYTGVAVTPEPGGGRPAPTGPIVVKGQF